jgi:hypothetical protein
VAFLPVLVVSFCCAGDEVAELVEVVLAVGRTVRRACTEAAKEWHHTAVANTSGAAKSTTV